MTARDASWHCRSCGSDRVVTILDLGAQPSADRLVAPGEPPGAEPVAELALGVCTACWLVQLAPTSMPDEPPHGHGTPFSSTTLEHLATWADEAIGEAGLGAKKLVVDVAAGSGHLLAPFLARGVRVHAIEADPSSAGACRSAGIPTTAGTIGTAVVEALPEIAGQADLVLVNHALAHVEDLSDAIAGIARLLAPGGMAAIEFHHLLRLVVDGQFDAVCHAHRCYLSLTALSPLLVRHGLRVVDARSSPAHGGTIRAIAVHQRDAVARSTHDATARLDAALAAERAAGLDRAGGFAGLAAAAEVAVSRFRSFLERARADGRRVAGYGAPSRAVTLCVAAGVSSELLPFTVDRSPDKQGRLLPGCRVPILDPGAIEETRPDLIVILPWTLRDEIVGELQAARSWGARFVTAMPELTITDG
jgi:SAM-dependent methyltransferase